MEDAAGPYSRTYPNSTRIAERTPYSAVAQETEINTRVTRIALAQVIHACSTLFSFEPRAEHGHLVERDTKSTARGFEQKSLQVEEHGILGDGVVALEVKKVLLPALWFRAVPSNTPCGSSLSANDEQREINYPLLPAESTSKRGL